MLALPSSSWLSLVLHASQEPGQTEKEFPCNLVCKGTWTPRLQVLSAGARKQLGVRID